MIPPHSHQDLASLAASHADRLQGDLVTLQQMLNNYTSSTADLGSLEDSSARSIRQLEAIANRLDALGQASDHDKYKLSDQEHAAFDFASDLRARMMDTLSRLQQAERASHRPA